MPSVSVKSVEREYLKSYKIRIGKYKSNYIVPPPSYVRQIEAMLSAIHTFGIKEIVHTHLINMSIVYMQYKYGVTNKVRRNWNAPIYLLIACGWLKVKSRWKRNKQGKILTKYLYPTPKLIKETNVDYDLKNAVNFKRNTKKSERIANEMLRNYNLPFLVSETKPFGEEDAT